MIKSKVDLLFYIKEDYRRNLGETSKLKWLALQLWDNDRYRVVRYLRALRKYEYAINVQRNKLLGNVIWAYRKWQWHRLSIKYNLVLPPNVIGYGFKMAHVVGGGDNY